MTSDDTIEMLDFPNDPTVYLTLDLECDYGTALDGNSLEAAQRTDELADILERHSVSLTCFLQTELLTAAPESVEPLERASVPVEFHAHTHTHPSRADADIEYEVTESVDRIVSRFDPDAIGFRFPDGDRRNGDYGVLSRAGVDFSSSVFPSWRPGRFNNMSVSRRPFYDRQTDIIELPFSVHSELVRVPIALSYLKLIGRPFKWLVAQSPPDTIIFDMHMHDLFVPSAYDGLTNPYKLVYARNKHAGVDVFEWFIRDLKRNGYSFGRLSELYETMERSVDA